MRKTNKTQHRKFIFAFDVFFFMFNGKETRGSVGWACVAHLSFFFEETLQNLPLVASHQVSVHLAKQLQRRRFLEIDQSETRMACGGHVYFFFTYNII